MGRLQFAINAYIFRYMHRVNQANALLLSASLLLAGLLLRPHGA
jgi:hypothetical protein